VPVSTGTILVAGVLVAGGVLVYTYTRRSTSHTQPAVTSDETDAAQKDDDGPFVDLDDLGLEGP